MSDAPATPPPTPPDDPLERLAADCDFEFFRSSGPGGQNVNRRETAVRLTHRPTGVVVTAQEERTQGQNRRIALEKLRARLAERARRRRPRKPTQMPRGVRERILQHKRERSEKKSMRRKPDRE